MNRLKSIVRSKLRETTLDILGLGSKPSKGIHLLNGHLLSKDENLDADFFDRQLSLLSKKSTVIPFSEAVHLINSKRAVNHSLVAFSYDDGFGECYSHIAPVLEKYNGYSCFFICPNFIDGVNGYIDSFLKDKVHQKAFKRPMSWSQINNLSERGHIIGAHSMDHIRISEIDDINEMHYQIGECKKVISEKTGRKCDFFAFPYGHIERDFDSTSIQVAETYYRNIFSASNWQRYFSYNKRVINRRHCEPYWKASHINYFLSKKITY